MKRLEKSEIMYLIFSFVIATGLAIIINNQAVNTAISSWNPIAQFLILQVGIYVTLFGVLKFVAKGKRAAKFSWEGALSQVLIFLGVDLFLPPYQVSAIAGLQGGGVFAMSSNDYVLGYIFSSMGASGWLLWILVYPISFAVLFLAGSFMFRDWVSRWAG